MIPPCPGIVLAKSCAKQTGLGSAIPDARYLSWLVDLWARTHTPALIPPRRQKSGSEDISFNLSLVLEAPPVWSLRATKAQLRTVTQRGGKADAYLLQPCLAFQGILTPHGLFMRETSLRNIKGSLRLQNFLTVPLFLYLEFCTQAGFRISQLKFQGLSPFSQ